MNCSNPVNLDNLKHLHCYYNLSFVFFKTFLFLLFFSLGIPAGLKHAAQPRKDLDFFSSCLCLRVLIPGERQLGGTEDPGDRASRPHARPDSAHRSPHLLLLIPYFVLALLTLGKLLYS